MYKNYSNWAIGPFTTETPFDGAPCSVRRRRSYGARVRSGYAMGSRAGAGTELDLSSVMIRHRPFNPRCHKALDEKDGSVNAFFQ